LPIPDELIAALSDDLNTPMAITAMHKMAREAKGGDSRAAAHLGGAADFLGLQRHRWDAKVEQFVFKAATDDAFNNEIESKIERRNAARKAKNFAESDRIRDELAAMGIVLKDTKDGTIWEIAR
jgi:cysteinyl-tRNA synthetase